MKHRYPSPIRRRGAKGCLFGCILGASLIAPSPARAAVVQMLIPLYSDPVSSSNQWNQVISAAGQIQVTAIINPQSGPVAVSDPKYQGYSDGIARLVTAGVTVLGYVPTSFGNRDPADIQTEITLYNDHYGLNGIFFDEVSSDATATAFGGGSTLTYYSDLYDYITGASAPDLSTVFGNPGTQANESYLTDATRGFDTLTLFENFQGWGSYTPEGYVTNATHPSTEFSSLLYSISSTNNVKAAINLADDRNFNYVFVTDDGGANPWDQLPSYFQTEVDYIEAVNLGNRDNTLIFNEVIAAPEPSSIVLAIWGGILAFLPLQRKTMRENRNDIFTKKLIISEDMNS